MSKNYQIIPSYEAYYPKLIELFESARLEIYMASWLIDFDTEIKPGMTFSSLLRSSAARGVRIHILLFENPIEKWVLPKSIPGCSIKLAPPFGPKLNFPFNHLLALSLRSQGFPANAKISSVHQKYIAIDGQQVLIGQTDLNHERRGNIQTKSVNSRGFIWHEFGLLVACPSQFWDFCSRNHDAGGHADHPGPPFVGSFSKPESELDLYHKLIQTAKSSILIENQIFFNTGICKHELANALINRLRVAYEKREDFHVLIVTNNGQPDLDCGNHDKFIKLYKQQTRHYLDTLMVQASIPTDWLNSRFKICRMGNHSPTHFIHSKIMIIDGSKGTLSSTNLTDRSLRPDLQDRELGIRLDAYPGLVQDLQMKMFRTYVAKQQANTPTTLRSILKAVDTQESLLVSEKPFSETNIAAKKAGLLAFGATAKTAAHGIFW